jgi:hypothetical protein
MRFAKVKEEPQRGVGHVAKRIGNPLPSAAQNPDLRAFKITAEYSHAYAKDSQASCL